MGRRICPFVVAVACLMGFRASSAIDEQKAIEFIEACRNLEGSVPNLRLIYLRGKILEAAGISDREDSARFVDYIRSCLNRDGGYGFWPGDPSTVEATFEALEVLRKFGAKPSQPGRSAEFLESRAESLASEISKCPYPGYAEEPCEELYHALMGLSFLGRRPHNLLTLVGLLLEAPKVHGIFYYTEVCKAYGLEIGDRESMVGQLEEEATAYFLGLWGISEMHHCLAAAEELGGSFEYGSWIKSTVGRRLGWEMRRGNIFQRLEAGYHAGMLAKLLGRRDLLEGFARRSAIDMGPEGGFGSFPGCPTDEVATLYALEALKLKGVSVELGGYVEALKQKQRLRGFFQFNPVPERAEEVRKAEARIHDTWIALSILNLVGERPDDPISCAKWLQNMLDEGLEDMGLMEVFEILESLHLLGEKPKNSEKLIAFLRGLRNRDSYFAIRSLQLLGAKLEDLGPLREKIEADLERFKAQKLGLGLLYRKLSALELVGGSVEDIGYYEDLLERLQNPDGGFRKPTDMHSNIYETSIALRMWDILQGMK